MASLSSMYILDEQNVNTLFIFLSKDEMLDLLDFLLDMETVSAEMSIISSSDNSDTSTHFLLKQNKMYKSLSYFRSWTFKY